MNETTFRYSGAICIYAFTSWDLYKDPCVMFKSSQRQIKSTALYTEQKRLVCQSWNYTISFCTNWNLQLAICFKSDNLELIDKCSWLSCSQQNLYFVKDHNLHILAVQLQPKLQVFMVRESNTTSQQISFSVPIYKVGCPIIAHVSKSLLGFKADTFHLTQ